MDAYQKLIAFARENSNEILRVNAAFSHFISLDVWDSANYEDQFSVSTTPEALTDELVNDWIAQASAAINNWRAAQ